MENAPCSTLNTHYYWKTTLVKTCPVFSPQSTADNAVYVDALSFSISYPLSKGGKLRILTFYSSLDLLTFY